MLQHISLSQVQDIIKLAESLNAKHPPSPNGISSPSNPSAYQAYRQDEASLVAAINSLTMNARAELMALMYVGRDAVSGSKTVGTLEEAYADRLREASPHDTHQIADKTPALPKYLRKGLETACPGS